MNELKINWKSVTLQAAIIGGILSLLGTLADCIQNNKIHSKTMQVEIASKRLEASQGYYTFCRRWLAAHENPVELKKIFDDFWEWDMNHALYITSDSRKLSLKLSGEMRNVFNTILPPKDPAELHKRINFASGVAYELMESLLKDCWLEPEPRKEPGLENGVIKGI